MTAVLLDTDAVNDLRAWLASDLGSAFEPRVVLDLVSEAVRHVAAWFDVTPSEGRSSGWRVMSLADDEILPDLVVHLRVGDAGDLMLVVDRALVVINLRFTVAGRP